MLTIDNSLLVLIDIQGKLASLMHDKEMLYKNLEIITKSMNILKIPIIWMEQVPDKLGPTIDEISSNFGRRGQRDHRTPTASRPMDAYRNLHPGILLHLESA